MRCLVKPFSQRRLLTVLKELLSAGTAEKNDDWAPDLG